MGSIKGAQVCDLKGRFARAEAGIGHRQLYGNVIKANDPFRQRHIKSGGVDSGRVAVVG
jgi:hypothetical protein